MRQQTIVIVLDSVGIGEAPDANEYGDVGSDTLGNMADAVGGLDVPNLAALGLGNIQRDRPIRGVPPSSNPRAAFGRMRETAFGKDTATGHWEFMGLVLDKPFRTFPEGFPSDMIDAFCDSIGVSGVLGNRAESGTVIIEELGREHLKTGLPIVYTSADPVFQIAAHKDVVPIERLYDWCEKAYELVMPQGLSRVIARPFEGQWPDYSRTHERKDYALPPPRPTILDELANANIKTLGIGKICSIYSGSGIAANVHTRDNVDGIRATLEAMHEDSYDFVFTNLVDFDSKYGHRRNPEGYAECLAEFDRALPAILDAMGPEDLLLITADHGNDPTYRGTDHTREYVPVLAVGRGATPGHDLGTRRTFADLGKTVAHSLGVDCENPLGESFLAE